MTNLDYFLNVLERCRKEDAEMLARHSPQTKPTLNNRASSEGTLTVMDKTEDYRNFHQYEDSSQINPEGRR